MSPSGVSLPTIWRPPLWTSGGRTCNHAKCALCVAGAWDDKMSSLDISFFFYLIYIPTYLLFLLHRLQNTCTTRYLTLKSRMAKRADGTTSVRITGFVILASSDFIYKRTQTQIKIYIRAVSFVNELTVLYKEIQQSSLKVWNETNQAVLFCFGLNGNRRIGNRPSRYTYFQICHLQLCK